MLQTNAINYVILITSLTVGYLQTLLSFDTMEYVTLMTSMQSAPYVPRLAEKLVRQLLSDFRVVMIEGPRQAGKTTLLKQLAGGQVPYVSCADPLIQDHIDADVDGFAASLGRRAIIDEIQHRPGFFSAIKSEVDTRPAKGRFILAGSSTISALSQLGDSLAGRACMLKLLPFSQAELQHASGNDFLVYLFGKRTDNLCPHLKLASHDVAAARGGYPEMQDYATARQRSGWLRHYCEALRTQEVPHIRQMRASASLRKVLTHLARVAPGKLSVQKLSRDLGIAHPTANHHVLNMMDLDIISALGNYDPTLRYCSARKQPKLQFNDSGLLATLLQFTEKTTSAIVYNARIAARIFECFVFSEIIKLCHAVDQGHEVHYWSDRYAEVDIVIQHEGRIVGVEVKRKRSVNRADFKSLFRLAGLADNMNRGVVIHAGDQFSAFQHEGRQGPVTMQAIPAGWLWAS